MVVKKFGAMVLLAALVLPIGGGCGPTLLELFEDAINAPRGGTVAFFPYGVFIHSNGEYPPANGSGGSNPPPMVPDGDGFKVTVCGETYKASDSGPPAGTALRIWREADGTDTLSICTWVHGEGFDCEPSLSGLLASDGVTLVAILFHADGKIFEACAGSTVVNAGQLPDAVTATAAAIGQKADGGFIVYGWENYR